MNNQYFRLHFKGEAGKGMMSWAKLKTTDSNTVHFVGEDKDGVFEGHFTMLDAHMAQGAISRVGYEGFNFFKLFVKDKTTFYSAHDIVAYAGNGIFNSYQQAYGWEHITYDELQKELDK